MSWLDGITDIFVAGVRKPRASALDLISGVVYNYNAVTGRHELTFSGGGPGGSGDVVGPASSVNLRLAVFSGTTGKLLADGGSTIASLLSSAASSAAAGDAATLASALAAVVPVNKGGTGQTGLGSALQVLRTNAAANGTEWASVAAGLTGPANPADDGKVAIASAGNLSYALLANANVAAAAAIAGSKIAPDFAAQVVRTTGQFVGASSGTPAAVSDAGSFESCTTSSGSLRGLCHRQASADANGACVVLQKSRGTHASPTAHNADDALGALLARGHDGSAFFDAFKLQAVAEQAGGTGKRTRVESYVHDGTSLVKTGSAVRVKGQTTDATQKPLYSILLAADTTVRISAVWHGKQTTAGGTSNRAHRETTITIRRFGSAGPTEIGHSDGIALYRDDATWGTSTQIGYTLNGTTNGIDFHALGKLSTDIDWYLELSWTVL